MSAVLFCACGDAASMHADAGMKGLGGAKARGADGGASCAKGMLREAGKCIDPLRRYEPKEAVDHDNVVSYAAAPELALPDPPKSGFRLIAPARRLAAGQEVEDCHAWQYPQLQNLNVYAARVYTSGGLHHSNVFGVPIAADGPSPYPACAPKQADVDTQLPNILKGDIMDVLFANSTQIQGGEQIVFPKGMAFKIKTEGREVATTVHWLNPSSSEIISEVVYDFFTMPDAQVTQEIVPFVSENESFSIPAHSKGLVETTCDLLHEGNIVSIMPHAHVRTTAFAVDLIDANGMMKTVLHDTGFDGTSHIHVFDQPISTAGFTKIQHACSVNNDLGKPIVYGIGQNEMCTLFGYLYPPSAQQLGVARGALNADGSSPPCQTLDIGAHR